MEMKSEKIKLLRIVDRFFGTTGGYSGNYNVFGALSGCNAMICGGTISSLLTEQRVNDLDFYVKRPQDLVEMKRILSIFFELQFESLNAMTFSRKVGRKKYTVQLISRFTGDAHTIFEWFDFTITHGAYDFSKGDFVFGPRFLPDLAARRLIYSGFSKYPICAMYRTKKYMSRGYSISGATIMHIALAIVQLKISNYRELKEQLMGVDTMFLQGLLAAKSPDAPVEFGEFMDEAFKCINEYSGKTAAEKEEDDEDAAD